MVYQVLNKLFAKKCTLRFILLAVVVVVVSKSWHQQLEFGFFLQIIAFTFGKCYFFNLSLLFSGAESKIPEKNVEKKVFPLKKSLFFLDIFVVALVQESRTQIIEIGFDGEKIL